MYHDGYTKFGTLISGTFKPSVCLDSNTVKVNPHTLVDDVACHFDSYIVTLKNSANTNERVKFEATFDHGTTATP